MSVRRRRPFFRLYAFPAALCCLLFRLPTAGNTPDAVVAPVQVAGLQTETDAPAPRKQASPESVLVVMNTRSLDSRAIADHYVDARHIPIANVLRIDCPVSDGWTVADYRSRLETFVRQRARENPAIEYVVLTRGVPYYFSDYGTNGGYSTDCILSTCLMEPRPAPHSANPYFGADEPFSRAKYGFLLVTRLDGPTKESGIKEIDSSINAKPLRGPFYLRDSFVESMEAADKVLIGRGLTTEWVEGFNNAAFPRYEGVGGPYMAHWGAGPHDTQFTMEKFGRLRFLPGAICDITWSNSASGLRNAASIGNIAILTDNGAAGAQGYVSEPYSDALSKAEIVLERYTHGYNLAESFSMGTPYLNWKQVVLGDPLCAPYAGHPFSGVKR